VVCHKLGVRNQNRGSMDIAFILTAVGDEFRLPSAEEISAYVKDTFDVRIRPKAINLDIGSHDAPLKMRGFVILSSIRGDGYALFMPVNLNGSFLVLTLIIKAKEQSERHVREAVIMAVDYYGLRSVGYVKEKVKPLPRRVDEKTAGTVRSPHFIVVFEAIYCRNVVNDV
jgi:hypothetical protein